MEFKAALQAIPGGQSYPHHICFKKGPFVFSIDDAIQTDSKSASIRYQDVLTPAETWIAAPTDWIGYGVLQLTLGGKNYRLVPFADSGQKGTRSQVWIPISDIQSK